ncbi:MAG TPA: DUF4019 domain-containing protein [Caulobacteraceae bacterium]|jgi:hypothetical protein|nr:DUF4019 domain-containing protein [Caulobacteraceae bacterium]
MVIRLTPLAAGLGLALSGFSLAAAEPLRQVNVTTDSAPGWSPTEDLEATARKTAADYFADEDGGRYREAYARLTERYKKQLSFKEYARLSAELHDKAGAAIERRITVVTWTKDPAHAPAPGVYVALDLAGRFANADRYCGYLVLYQPPSGGAFGVVREETAFIDNVSARSIEQEKSQAVLDETWAKMSANCPNYQASAAPAAPPAALPEAKQSTIGYPNVDAALKDLHARPGVVISTDHGWTIATDEATRTFWSFPPPGHPAYPAAVKRWLVDDNGAVVLKMEILCQASKAACDDLVRSFQQLNAQMSASMQKKP